MNLYHDLLANSILLINYFHQSLIWEDSKKVSAHNTYNSEFGKFEIK